jgi:hypothetical protein
MDSQPEVQWFMRPFLLDFLVEVHAQFRLRPETLYLALNLIDRYVSKRVVYKKHYQLVGCAALWTAAKFEDQKDRVPLVKELSEMCCKAYDENAFVQMEGSCSRHSQLESRCSFCRGMVEAIQQGGQGGAEDSGSRPVPHGDHPLLPRLCRLASLRHCYRRHDSRSMHRQQVATSRSLCACSYTWLTV